MKCPICESPLRPGLDRCPDCGYRLPQGHTVPVRDTPKPPPATRPKRSLGCGCCLIVLLPLLVTLILGMVMLSEVIVDEVRIALDEFVFDRDAFDYEWPSTEDYPSEELTPESIPAPADEGCFAIVDHTLMFVPENWDGSPILNVPEYIGGEQVLTIGPGCFMDCTDLTTILLPESVTAIGPKAFAGCENLRGLFLHDGLTSIGQDAFSGCTALEAISIPASVTHIAPHAFDDCANLLYIFYGGIFEDWDALYSGYINPFTTAICLDGSYYHGSDR